MARIDYSALEYSNKALTAGFIAGIAIGNCILIFKTLKRGGWFYTPKSLTLISLALGDIFLALFSLVIHARLLFEDDFVVACSTFRVYQIYLEFFIHFLFGCGLIVLLLELMYRYKRQPSRERTTGNILKSVCCSACPWILSILIVLPLTMAGETEGTTTCFNTLSIQRFNAMYVVSIILPAAAVVLVAIGSTFVRIPPEYYFHQSINNHATEQTAFTNAGERNGVSLQYNTTGAPQNPPSAAAEKSQLASVSYLQGPAQHPGPNVHGTPSMATTTPGNASNLGGQAFSAPQYPAQQQYPVQQHYPMQQQQYPMQQQYFVSHHSMQYNTQSNVVFAAPAYQLQAPAVFPAPGKERRLLISASVVYVICVVPIAVYNIGNPDSYFLNSFTGVVLSTTFFWLSIVRSLITPCIFSDSPTYM